MKRVNGLPFLMLYYRIIDLEGGGKSIDIIIS